VGQRSRVTVRDRLRWSIRPPLQKLKLRAACPSAASARHRTERSANRRPGAAG
jgi:hypothetical protein